MQLANASVIPQKFWELEDLPTLQYLHQAPVDVGCPGKGPRRRTRAITVQLRAVDHHQS